jgi:2,4-dichlorophenol 6-monooxygenase
VVAWRDKEGTLDAEDAAEKLSSAVRAVLDLADLSTIPREKPPEPSTPSGTPLFV